MNWKRNLKSKNIWELKLNKHMAGENVQLKRHPIYGQIFVSCDGKIVRIQGERVLPKLRHPKPNTPLLTICYNGVDLSLPKIVLEAWNGLAPDDGKRYFAKSNLEDKTIIMLSELEWSIAANTEGYRSKACKLTVEDDLECFTLYKNGIKTQKELALKYNVSDMSINRAIKRAQKLTTN